MDVQVFRASRRSLHGVAELVLAGPAYARDGDIRLRPTPGGFGVWAQPGPRINGVELVAGTRRVPLGGTVQALADAAGVAPRALTDVFADGAGVGLADAVEVDAEAAELLAAAFADGDRALEMFAPDAERVLWPEHFDIGISVDAERINYGVSPGDSYEPWPYAYVGPWEPREGAFFNAAFGAARRLSELGDAVAIAAFFAQGRGLALR
jgi:hypothetical protein